MIWHDTPPTVAGTYWVKVRTSGEEWPMRLHEDGAFEGHPSEVQFGPRIPTADELAELPGLIDKYADEGIQTIESNDVLKLQPFSQMGSPVEIVRSFGGRPQYLQALQTLERELYALSA